MSAFAETLVRKGTLDPIQRNSETVTKFLDYTGEPTLLQSVYGELAEKGIKDTELLKWQRVTSVLNRPILPSAKRAFEQLQTYELPVPGSPSLKKITLQALTGFCRGAASVTLSSTAYHAATAIGGPTTVLALVMLQGTICTLTFIAIRQIAPFIETHMFGRKR